MKKNLDFIISEIIILSLLYLQFKESPIIYLPLVSAFWVLLGIKYWSIYEYRKEFIVKNKYNSHLILLQKNILSQYPEHKNVVSKKIKEGNWVYDNRKLGGMFLFLGTLGLLEFFIPINKTKMLILQILDTPLLSYYIVGPITVYCTIKVILDNKNTLTTVENVVLTDYLNNIKKSHFEMQLFNILINEVRKQPTKKKLAYLFKLHIILSGPEYKANKLMSETLLRMVVLEKSKKV